MELRSQIQLQNFQALIIWKLFFFPHSNMMSFLTLHCPSTFVCHYITVFHYCWWVGSCAEWSRPGNFKSSSEKRNQMLLMRYEVTGFSSLWGLAVCGKVSLLISAGVHLSSSSACLLKTVTAFFLDKHCQSTLAIPCWNPPTLQSHYAKWWEPQGKSGIPLNFIIRRSQDSHCKVAVGSFSSKRN